jgi:hypothetical protein
LTGADVSVASTAVPSRLALAAAPGSGVHAIYDGCWMFADGQPDEDRAIRHRWRLALEREHAYSLWLVIDTGDDLVEVTGEDDEPKRRWPAREYPHGSGRADAVTHFSDDYPTAHQVRRTRAKAIGDTSLHACLVVCCVAGCVYPQWDGRS